MSREEQITGFESLESGWTVHLEITQGETFKELVSADDNLVEHIQVSKQGSTLFVGLEEGSRLSGDIDCGDAAFEA